MNKAIISVCIALLEQTLGGMSPSDADAIVKGVTNLLKTLNERSDI